VADLQRSLKSGPVRSDVFLVTAAHPDTGFDLHALVDEVERYLDTVRLFREEGCEPHWTAEEPVSPPDSTPVQMPLFVAE
jgi:hypothetical protein